MIIRPAKKKDLLICEKLLHLSEFRFANGKYPKVEYLEHYLDNNYFLIVEVENKIVGCILGEPVKANGVSLLFIVVEKEYKNRGIGTKLFLEFEKKSRKNGIKWFNLYAVESNEALGFYSKNNFHIGQSYTECKKILD